MAKEKFIVVSQVRVGGVLYREGEPLTCDPKELAGCEDCVTPASVIEAKAAAEAEAEAEAKAKAEAEAKAKAAADAKAKAGK